MSEIVFNYFPQLSEIQKKKLSSLNHIYQRWNSMINVISRKDMGNFNVHHVLHSLAIAKIITFIPGTRILDAGTGGGFPGIPLAILFPDAEFTLLDSIQKKIMVVSSVADELELGNVTTVRKRVEDEEGRYDFVISRAVTEFTLFVKMTEKNIDKHGKNSLNNGIIYLKGGDLSSEISHFKNRMRIWNINEIFHEPYFETKKIVYLSV